jgi:TPR repeat protein
VLHHNGKGCQTDYEEAYNWWKLAADQGYKDAVHYVGYCYEYGRGITKNISKAKEYYSKSAAMGFEQSKESLKKLG